VTKSVVSALVGIALGEGKLKGLGQTVGELLARHLPPDADPRVPGHPRAAADMTSGLAGDDPSLGGDPRVSQRQGASRDWVRHILGRRLAPWRWLMRGSPPREGSSPASPLVMVSSCSRVPGPLVGRRRAGVAGEQFPDGWSRPLSLPSPRVIPTRAETTPLVTEYTCRRGWRSWPASSAHRPSSRGAPPAGCGPRDAGWPRCRGWWPRRTDRSLRPGAARSASRWSASSPAVVGRRALLATGRRSPAAGAGAGGQHHRQRHQE